MLDTYLSKKCENCEHLVFKKLKTCLDDLFINSVKIVNLIDDHYKYENNWKDSPQDYFTSEIINGYCIRYKESFLEN